MKYVAIAGVIVFAVVLGVGLWATNFTVYLGNDPTACANCHVMDAAYEGWYHARHQQWAACVDCHAPHSTIPKYLFKARSGMVHVTMFTLNKIPEPLRAIPISKEIIQDNCIRCHETAVSMINDGVANVASSDGNARYCVFCHRTVAHGERGISVLPYQDKGIYTPRDYQPQAEKEQ